MFKIFSPKLVRALVKNYIKFPSSLRRLRAYDKIYFWFHHTGVNVTAPIIHHKLKFFFLIIIQSQIFYHFFQSSLKFKATEWVHCITQTPGFPRLHSPSYTLVLAPTHQGRPHTVKMHHWLIWQTFKCFRCHQHSHISSRRPHSPQLIQLYTTPTLEPILTVLHLWLELVRVGSREITRRGYNDDAGAQLSFPVLIARLTLGWFLHIHVPAGTFSLW